jgi:electron transfer flavoprotein beta subunit
MRILVCVKQVPEPERIVVSQGADVPAFLEEVTEFRMNRFDEFAVEEALVIREQGAGVSVDAVSAGPPRVTEALKRAIGMGADHGIHLLTGPCCDPEPAAVSAWIAACAGDRRYTLLFTGNQSEDGMHGMVGPMTAERMGLPYATQVIALQLSKDLSSVTVQREIEGGARETLVLELPALLALQPGINRPRYPSLSNLLRANRQPLEVVDVSGLADPPATLARGGMELPRRSRALQMLTGTPREKAEQFLRILREKALIR